MKQQEILEEIGRLSAEASELVAELEASDKRRQSVLYRLHHLRERCKLLVDDLVPKALR